jgi:hypothetical protein
MMEQMVTTVEK